MPFDKFAAYCRAEGFCCPMALLSARRDWNTWALAEDAGISMRMAREWREKARKKKLYCQRKKDCLIEKTLAQKPFSTSSNTSR